MTEKRFASCELFPGSKNFAYAFIVMNPYMQNMFNFIATAFMYV